MSDPSKMTRPAIPEPVMPASTAPSTSNGTHGKTLPDPVVPPLHVKNPPPAIAQSAAPPAVTATHPIKPPTPPQKKTQSAEDDEGARMGFMDHLLELRGRLWACIITMFVCMLLSLVFYKQLFDVVRWPLDKTNSYYSHDVYAHTQLKLPPGEDIAAITNADPLGTMLMMVWIGVGVGLLLSSPIVFYQLWGFVAPGLKDNEKKAIKPVLYGGIVFFSLGAFIGYYFLFQVSIDFFVWLDIDLKVRPLYTIEYYTSLLLNVMWVSGLACELPLIVGALARLRVIKPSHLTHYWRMCILTAFILGAVLSPGTDIMSMMVFSLLFLGLYVASVIMAFFFYPREAAV